MVSVTSKSWWRSRLPNVSAAVSRFQLAVLIAALLTAFKLAHGDVGDVENRVLGALAGSFLWVLAVDFYVENQKRSFPVRIALWLGGILVTAILFRFAWDIWFSPPLLLGSLLLLVGLAGHLGRGESNATFWLFNHRLWLGALLALKPEEMARELLVALGLRPANGNVSGAIYFTHYSDVPATLSFAKGGTMLGPVVFEGGGPVARRHSSADGLSRRPRHRQDRTGR